MNEARNGNFTSSEIVALTKLDKSGKNFGVPALTYIEECNMERRLGRSIETESNAKAFGWGKLNEKRVFDMLGLEYIICSEETLSHPAILCWKGSPDAKKVTPHNIVVELKCPITLKSFCQLVDPIYKGLTGMDAMNEIRAKHKDGEKYYQQIVSNAILTGSDYAEFIVYAPYKSEIEDIQEAARNYDGNQNGMMWLNWASENEIPWLLDGGFYRSMNIISFEIPKKDKEFLTEQVLKAEKMLVPFIITAELDKEVNAIIVE